VVYPVAVLKDRRCGTFTAVLALRAATFAQRHQTYLAVSLDPQRGAARERIAALGGGDLGAAATLFAVLHQVRAGLEEAAVEVCGWLPPRGPAHVLRAAFGYACPG
jgi:hypothetical protein